MSTPTEPEVPGPRLYRTGTMLTRTLRVRYPAGRGTVRLRTEFDWDRDLEPVTGGGDEGDTGEQPGHGYFLSSEPRTRTRRTRQGYGEAAALP